MRFLILFMLAQRYYWPTLIDTLWIGHQKHTHAATVGKVAYATIPNIDSANYTR